MPDYEAALHEAIEAARAAGALLRQGLNQPDEAPLFAARAEACIRDRLLASSNWSYRSDEAGLVVGGDPTGLWLVAPDDGLQDTNSNPRGRAVSIAALRDGRPILGVVYAYAWPDHNGDLLAYAEGCGRLRRNGRPVDDFPVDVPLDAAIVRFDARLIVFLSPEADRNPARAVQSCAPARPICYPSLAYRLALVAAGEGIGTLELGRPGAVCLAAGHAMLEGAGVRLVDSDGAAIRYSPTGESECPGCFAGGPSVVAALRRRDWSVVPPREQRPTFPLRRSARFGPAQLGGRLVEDVGVLSRACGCLMGQLAGDALGGLVEFGEPDEIRQNYPQGCRELMDGGNWNNLAGQPTDDSELALLLARTLVATGEYNEEAILAAYLDWYSDPETFDIGSTIGQALRAAVHEWDMAVARERLRNASNRSSQANGSLMRISPLGIFTAGHPAEGAALARRESVLTHPNRVCVESCACFVAALAAAIGGITDPETLWQIAYAEAGITEVRESLEAAREAPPTDFVLQQGWVRIALQNAFYQLLHARDPEDGLVATVMFGGDTDTTAAIAGALLGAVHGYEAIPLRWRQALRCCRPMEGTPTMHPRAREYWPVDAAELAECLLLAGMKP